MPHSSKILRRQFTTRVAAAAVASSVAGPIILNAQDKSGGGPVIVGSGQHTYQWIDHWGRESLPDGYQYGWTSNGVAIDSQDQLYVSHHGTHGSIYVFDNQGKFIRALASQFRGKKEAAGHGIDIRQEDGTEFLYLSPDDASISGSR